MFITDFNICDGKFDFPPNVILINLDEFLETNEFWKKKQFLYDIIRSIKPKTIHNINSSIMWDVIIEKGDEISQFSSIFGLRQKFPWRSSPEKSQQSGHLSRPRDHRHLYGAGCGPT